MSSFHGLSQYSQVSLFPRPRVPVPESQSPSPSPTSPTTFSHSRGNKLQKVVHRIYTLKLMQFMFKCCTESVLMKFVDVLRFLAFICVIHLSGKSQFIKFLNYCLEADCWENGIETHGMEVKHKSKLNGPRFCLTNIPQ